MKKNLESSNFSINILSAAPDQKIVRSVDNPIHKEGTLKILRGSLAPDGAVMKIASINTTKFAGKARVFEARKMRLSPYQKRK